MVAGVAWVHQQAVATDVKEGHKVMTMVTTTMTTDMASLTNKLCTDV